MGDFSVKAVLSAVDKNFSSTMKGAMGYADDLKSTFTSGLGFGAMMAVGQNAVSTVMGKMSELTSETIETSDSMYKLQAAMRFSGYAEDEIQRIAGSTGTLKTYADKTVFSLQDVMSTFGALSANGVKDADKLTEAVGNAVAVFGGGAQEYSSVALAFSQSMAAGKMNAQDWNQVLNASPQLAGGLKKELQRLNPVLENDFKGAMEDGAITAELLGQAMMNIGMTDMAKEAATSVTTFEGAMGNLEATAVSGMMSLYDTFAKSSVIDAINGFSDKIGSGFEWLSSVIPTAIENISPYWNAFRYSFTDVKDAFGGAVGAIVDNIGELTGAFGSTESVNNFSDVVGSASDALVAFAGFCEDHADIIAKVITILPKLYVGYKGFQIVKSVAPFIGTFSKGILMLAGKGVSTIAGKLLSIASAERVTGEASMESGGQMMQSAKAFFMLGAGVALISAGFALLAYSSIQLASAGPLAIGVMAGMVVAIGALLYVAKSVAPALTAGATGFVAFGASITLAGAGMLLLSSAAISLANSGPLAIGVMVGLVAVIALLAAGASLLGPALVTGGVGMILFGAGLVLVATAAILAGAALDLVALALPPISQYGLSGAASIAVLGASLLVFAVGAAVAGIASVVLGAGLIIIAAGLALVCAAVIITAMGILALSAGIALLGTGLLIVSAALPLVTIGALSSAVALMIMVAASVALAASLTLMMVPLLLISTTLLVASAGMLAFGMAVMTSSAGVLVLAVALKAVNSSMKTIAKNAKSAEKAISSMEGSVSVINSGLDALGSKAKSAVSKMTSIFSGSAGSAQSAAHKMMNGFNFGIQTGGNAAVVTTRSITNAINSSFMSAAPQTYNCGYWIGIGLANGMRASLGEVRSVAMQLAEAAETAVIAKAKIGSPAKVFIVLGKYIGKGLAIGIAAMEKLVYKNTEDLVAIPSVSTVPDMSISANVGSKNTELSEEYSYGRGAAYTIVVPLEIEGREFARATATYTQEELDQREKLNRYMEGYR